MSITNKDRRTIFALAREVGLDDDARKHVQLEITGKQSTTDMVPIDAGKLIAHLKKLRGPAKRYPRRAGRVPGNLRREPMLQKIEALLADMGLSWEYAESIAWRITGGKGEQPGSQPGVKRMEWVRDDRDLRAVVAALHVEQRKRHSYALIGRELERLQKDETWLESQIQPPWVGKWKRHTKRLNAIHEMLVAM